MPVKDTRGFELLDHIADLGFRAWALTLPDLFAECAGALTDVLVDAETVEVRERVGSEVMGADLESLLYAWLSEILYLYDADGWLFKEFAILSHRAGGSGEYLQAELAGERYDRYRHQIKTYVKAVTMHQLEVKHENELYSARVFLDI